MNSPKDVIRLGSPFDLQDDAAYRAWREEKLRDYPRSADELMVELKDPAQITAAEREELLRVVAKANSVLYRTAGGAATTKAGLTALGRALGLERMDGNLCADQDSISSIRVMPNGTRQEGYIPYTDRPINWHTDGYYNPSDRRIRAMLLHCACDAASGGENAIVDHEIVYIRLRDENPAFVAALMQPNVMTVPANTEGGTEVRGACTGPVFSVDPDGCLHMRYTARKRSIEWKQEPIVLAAVQFLEDLLVRGGDEYMFRHRLEPGQGILSNNALHNRSGFADDPVTGKVRLIYRARYYDRLGGCVRN